MIVHQAPRIAFHFVQEGVLFKSVKKSNPIMIIMKNFLTIRSSKNDMINRCFASFPCFSWHDYSPYLICRDGISELIVRACWVCILLQLTETIEVTLCYESEIIIRIESLGMNLVDKDENKVLIKRS